MGKDALVAFSFFGFVIEQMGGFAELGRELLGSLVCLPAKLRVFQQVLPAGSGLFTKLNALFPCPTWGKLADAPGRPQEPISAGAGGFRVGLGAELPSLAAKTRRP